MATPKLYSRIKQPDLFFSRLYYFTLMGGAGFINPFLNLFYKSLGLNGKQIGTFAATSAVIGLIAAPVIVNEIKKSPQARSLLQLTLVLGALAYFLISRQTEFAPIVLVVAFQALAASGVLPLSDSMAVSVSQAAAAGYGSIRVFGSLGWIVMVPASGWLIERLGYGAAFGGVSLGWICAAALIFFISPTYFTIQTTQDMPKSGLRTAIRKVVSDRTLLGFAIGVTAIGFLNSGVLQFENVFLSELGASKQLISIAGILSAIVELPFMLLSDRIIRRLGPHRIFLVALILTLLQRAAILVQPSIAMIMAMRFVGGVGFSFYTISFVALINSRTHTHETGTVLALFTVTLAGLVNIVASPLSGALYDIIGARWLYAFSVGGYAIAIASLWLTRPNEGLSHA
jgi:MFS transporter, PPP family, 3-phenylpropionic acid transporter